MLKEAGSWALPVPPHWTVSLFALRFDSAGLFRFQSSSLCGFVQQSVGCGRCPASYYPVCSSPAAAQKKDNLKK